MIFKRLTTFTLSSLGLAYLSNWAMDTGKEFLEQFLHLSPLAALSLIIFMDKAPAITRQFFQELGCYLKAHKTGAVKTIKESLIAVFLVLKTASAGALNTPLVNRGVQPVKKPQIRRYRRCMG